MPLYAACIDDPGLNPLQVREAASKQQARILKEIVSKQSAEKMIPLLRECWEQKREANLDMVYDPRIWARTVAKGDRGKEKILLNQMESVKKSYSGITEQLNRIRKEVSGVDFGVVRKNIDPPVIAEQIKNPEHLLVGRWYSLDDQPALGYKTIASELNFKTNGLAIIDRYALGETKRVTQGYGVHIQVMKWEITDATRRVPFEVSMGKTIEELKGYIYIRIAVRYISGKPDRSKYGKTDNVRYFDKVDEMRFLLKADGSAMVLPNPRSGRRDEAPFYARYVPGSVLSKKTVAHIKSWKMGMRSYIDAEKDKVTGICKKWDDVSIVNPYCKKFLAELNGISAKIEERALTPGQKKLKKVVSQYLFQPIKDYSDSVPIPTNLPYESMPGYACKARRDAWLEKRRAEGYSNSLWSMSVQQNISEADPGEDRDEFLRYAKALVVWDGGMITLDGKPLSSTSDRQIIHLREDGVFGLSWSPSYRTVEEPRTIRFEAGKEKPRIYYDPGNRWKFDGKRVNLFWNNDKQPYPMRGTAKYEIFSGKIVTDDERLYNAVIRHVPEADRKTWKTPPYVRLMKARMVEMEAYGKFKKPGQCDDMSQVSLEQVSDVPPRQQSRPLQSSKPGQAQGRKVGDR